MEKKPVSHIIAGLIVGTVGIILFLTYYFTGLSFQTDFVSWIPLVVTVGLIIFFVLQYAKAFNNNVSFGKLFSYGFKLTIIYTLLMTAFLFVVPYLFSDYKTQYMEVVANQMDTNKDLDEEKREAILTGIEKFFTISMVGGGLFLNLITGTIASLIGAAVAKKNPVTPFDNQMR